MQHEKIIYTAILRKKHTILTEFTDCSGNFSQITSGIMDEVINVMDNEPNKYKAKFFFGKYIFHILRDNKIYILTMTKPQKIKTDNDTLFFSFLFSVHEDLNKKKKNIFENPGKLRAYSLADFSPELKTKVIQFNSGEIKFNDIIINKQNNINKFDTLNEKQFEEYKQFPILSNEQVHSDKNVIPKEGEFDITEQADKTMDSFNDDILKSVLLVDNQNEVIGGEEPPFKINSINQTDFDLNFREKKRKKIWPKIVILVIIIIIIVMVLVYFLVLRK